MQVGSSQHIGNLGVDPGGDECERPEHAWLRPLFYFYWLVDHVSILIVLDGAGLREEMQVLPAI